MENTKSKTSVSLVTLNIAAEMGLWIDPFVLSTLVADLRTRALCSVSRRHQWPARQEAIGSEFWIYSYNLLMSTDVCQVSSRVSVCHPNSAHVYQSACTPLAVYMVTQPFKFLLSFLFSRSPTFFFFFH